VLETKVKHLESNHTNEVDELKQENCIPKSKTDKLVITTMDNVNEVKVEILQ
jgi:hypothetical protein